MNTGFDDKFSEIDVVVDIRILKRGGKDYLNRDDVLKFLAFQADSPGSDNPTTTAAVCRWVATQIKGESHK